MPARFSPRLLLVLTVLLAIGLGVVATLQWRWIGQWGDVEEARLAAALNAEAMGLDRAVTEALQAVAIAFAEIEVGDAHATDSLASRYRRWTTHRHASLLADVFWVRPGPMPRLTRFDVEAAMLQPVAWPDSLAAWRSFFSLYPAALEQRPTPYTFVLDDDQAPHDPLHLVLPVLPQTHLTRPRVRFLLLRLAPDALRHRVIQPHLVGGMLGTGAYDLLIASDDARPLYQSDEALALDDFHAPDVTYPVGPTSLGAQLAVTFLETGRKLDILNTEGIPRQGGRWTLRAQHGSGSIGAAIAALKRRHLGLAFGVLLVLGIGGVLLVGATRQMQRLANRQLTFVAGVTHELRTPLAVIRSAGENLADGVVATPDGVRRYGALVRDEGQRLSDLVEGVLALAGSDAAPRPAAPIDVEALVADAVHQARGALDAIGHAPTVEIDTPLPPLVGDAATLASALRNLLVNAARHGAPPIALRVSAEDTHVSFAVSDGGRGIAPADQARVFAPFYRGDAATGSGSGLGLALVWAVAEAHGGTIEAEGATLTLTLPAPVPPSTA